MNQNRVPKGVSTGGQYTASLREEPSATLAETITPTGSCPDCGAPMPGRIGTRDGHDIFLPGAMCSACPHTAAEIVFESDPDDEGYWYETQMGENGQIITDSYDPDGNHVERVSNLWANDDGYDDEAKMFGTTSTAVRAAREAVEGDGTGPVELCATDSVYPARAEQLRVGDKVILDNGDQTYTAATVTSVDGDHRTISVEFDNDEDTIASYDLDEPFVKVIFGRNTWAEEHKVDTHAKVQDLLFRQRLMGASPGDRLTDPANGETFVLAENRASRYYDGCAYCTDAKERKSTFFPPHAASPRCGSGGKNHCTCDRCF